MTGIPAYKYTNITYPDGKTRLTRVHRLVCEAWHPNPDNLPMVDHEDRDKMNNNKGNLRWCVRGTNSRNTDRTVVIFWQGEETTLAQLCDDLYNEQKPHYAFIWNRIKRGLRWKMLYLPTTSSVEYNPAEILE